MAEELKGKVFEPKRTGGLSAKPIGAHIFQKRGQVSDSAAPAARLVSYCVHGVLDTRIDDPRQAQERPQRVINSINIALEAPSTNTTPHFNIKPAYNPKCNAAERMDFCLASEVLAR